MSIDLKAGNLLKSKNGKIIKVLSILPEGINYCLDTQKCMFGYKDVNPILLTESLLEKYKYERYIGMEDLTDHLEYNVRGLIFRKFFRDGEFLYCTNDIYDEDTHSYTIPSLKYVHQLQNLYFALTGKELELDIVKE